MLNTQIISEYFKVDTNTAKGIVQAINNKELCNIRSYLDAYVEKPPYWMLIKISQELLRYTGAYFFFSAVDGWSYTE